MREKAAMDREAARQDESEGNAVGGLAPHPRPLSPEYRGEGGSDRTSNLHRAFIALGSNVQPEVHLPAAVNALAELGLVAAVSRVWESEPLGFLDQARFCNAAALLLTSDDPTTLRTKLRAIEDRLGRVRDPANKNGPRTIDLDVALYDDVVLNEGELVIPDPQIEERAFLAVPLAELAPEKRHPVTGRMLKEIAGRWGSPPAGLTLRSEVRLTG
jgi:2-amino-4-hydroxy-6-hydroxymethyldihydropteridine diphosphokinase